MEETLWRYSLPFSAKIPLKIELNSIAHVGPYEYAVDFLMPEGSEVLAPRPGLVVKIKDDSNKGGPSKEFENDANYITLAHCNEFSQLVHFRKDGIFAKEGEEVKEGQLLGYTGSTGWTYEPHLHFMVFKVLPDGKFQSLKIRFKE